MRAPQVENILVMPAGTGNKIYPTLKETLILK